MILRSLSQAKMVDNTSKYELITRNLKEVLGQDIIQKVMEERDLRLYWGTAPTGRPHCGYFVPMTKIADFLHADVEVTVLLADIHAFLDNMKAPWDLVQHRVKYYKFVIEAIMTSIGVPLDKLKFVVGSDYQYSRKYSEDNFRLAAVTHEHDARRAGAEVVKQSDSPLLSSLLYPGMQALDEEHLGVDVQFGGLDQRKIFVFAQDVLPKLGYKKRAHLMNHMVPGLNGGKMSASLGAENKIDLLDDATTVKKKIQKAFCEPGVVEENGLLAFAKFVLFPIAQLKKEQKPLFFINRPEKFGGPMSYDSYETMEEDYAAQKLMPQDLKIGIIDGINALLQPIRELYEASPEIQEIVSKAYPDTATKKSEKPVNSKKVEAAKEHAKMMDKLKDMKC